MKNYLQTSRVRRRKAAVPKLIQEETGIHVGISPNLRRAAKHSADSLRNLYRNWREKDRFAAWGRFKRNHFTIAVGGGNTIKAVYRAWLAELSAEVDWIDHVRFFPLEESTGEPDWESAQQSLQTHFITPLARKLVKRRGRNALARQLDLEIPTNEAEITRALAARLLYRIDLSSASRALRGGRQDSGRRQARSEALRYQRHLQQQLGASMSFHLIVSGIGKDGTLGAFAPYTRELAEKEPAVAVLRQESGSYRVALNRGVLTRAERVFLIVSGSLKLKALGRFEMEETTDFEQTVMETPLRILRESRDIAENVYIFADEQALHFDETTFEYRENGVPVKNRAETRAGDEDEGIHALLVHGFMGLFSFTNLLIRLPGSWTVSALHRGSLAMHLDNDEVFRHYANTLRKAVLKNWRRGRPSPVASHSIGGVVSDHLLLSLLDADDAPPRPYHELKAENRQLVDALRASGMIYLATWTPADGLNAGENFRGAIGHYRNRTPMELSGFEQFYDETRAGELRLVDEIDLESGANSMSGLDRFLSRWFARPLIGILNQGIRQLLGNRKVQQRMLDSNNPYILRLVNGRMLKVASYYGLMKEINASMHDPVAYQRRHLKSLEVLLEYDIPSLVLIHEDDFLVSARRHSQEHGYLLRRRLEKENVRREQDLAVPTRFVLLRRDKRAEGVDPLNPHLLFMATSGTGSSMARQVTAAMTDFVNETVYRAIRQGQVRPLDSVARWAAKQNKKRRARKVVA